jgi:uncharacterized protein YndB with AHSA1/START domain
MAHFELAVTVAATQEVVFAGLTDPTRMPRWLPITEAVEEVSGSLAEAGTTFVQKGAPGIRRPGGVVACDPPRQWHARLVGMGERVDLRFTLEDIDGATRLTLDADIKNSPPILGPLLDRLGAARIDRRMWRAAVENLKRELERDTVVPLVGAMYALRGGGHVRVGQVIDIDERCVHLRIFPGRWKTAPRSEAELHDRPRRPKDQFAIAPMQRTMRESVSLALRGSDALLADGGFGVGHMPLTLAEFDAAAAEPLDLPAPPVDVGGVRAWRERGGAAFGDARPPRVGAYFSVALQPMGVEAIGFGVVKLLHSQFRGAHVRVYSNVFLQRPAAIDEEALESRGLDLESLRGAEPPPSPTAPLAIGHLPVSHAAFAAWQPEFVEMALVDPEELLGYEEWKLAKGGFF